jgi:putative DNA primase/helicase
MSHIAFGENTMDGTFERACREADRKAARRRDDPPVRALTDEPTDDDIEIGRLARLSPIEYERDRKVAAEQMGVRTTILDRLVAVERDNIDGDGAKQGRGLTLPEPQPWHEPTDGGELLRGLSAAIRRHVVIPDHVADAVAMWVAHTYIVECFGISPRLAITSPEKGCGKTTLLDVLSRLVWRPLSTANATAAAIFRVVEMSRPTLLIDEADTFLRDNEELRGVLNSGHRRGGAVLRTVGDDHEPRPFATYSACAIALIGKLPATLADRSITAELRRRLASEAVEPFRHDRTTHLDILARKAARWASDNADCVRVADPDIPAGTFNRLADNWRPLLAIADAAGGEWPKRARHVLAMMAGATTGDQSAGVLVLADTRNIFGERGEDRLPSTELAEALVAIESRPWAEWRHGKPITANGLARLLEPFGVAPTTIRVGTKTPKGYRLSDFADAFERYLTPDAQEGASEPQHRNKADEMGTSTTSATATAAPLLRFENAKKPNNDGQCCGVAVANPGKAHRAHLETRCDHCGQPATSADPLHPWDWPGRPDGIWLHSRCEAAWVNYGKSVSPLAAEADMLDIPAFLRRSAAGGSPVA